MEAVYLTKKEKPEIFDVFGPTLVFLTPAKENDDGYCVMKGAIPPGVSVPMHSHPDHHSLGND